MFRKLYVILVSLKEIIKSSSKLTMIKKIGRDPIERKRLASAITHHFGNEVMRATGAEITIMGKENIPYNETALYVANHQSFFDIPLLFKVVHDQIGFVAKIEIKKWPIIRDWVIETNGIFYDRRNLREAVKGKVKEQEIKTLKEGNSLFIFPQGTRKENKHFDSGSFSVAKEAGVPVVPIVISGTKNIIKGNVRKSGIQVTFLNPFFVNPKDNVNKIARNVEKEINEERENHKKLVKKI